MKKIEDFKIINDTAILEGIAFKDEAIIVDDFLKNNSNIKNVSLKTSDNRYFELVNKKLILSSTTTFINPYFNNSLSKESLKKDFSQDLEVTSVTTSKTEDISNDINNLKKDILSFSDEICKRLEKLEGLINFKG